MQAKDVKQLAWVIGGSRGIGRAVVHQLAEAGFDLMFSYRANLAAAQEELAQVGAVLCRIDQMIKQANREKKEKEKKEKGKSSEIF